MTGKKSLLALDKLLSGYSGQTEPPIPVLSITIGFISGNYEENPER